MCLIVVGALAPLCFLFSVFQHARPPATPRRLGPPLTERSKTLGPAQTSQRRHTRNFSLSCVHLTPGILTLRAPYRNKEKRKVGVCRCRLPQWPVQTTLPSFINTLSSKTPQVTSVCPLDAWYLDARREEARLHRELLVVVRARKVGDDVGDEARVLAQRERPRRHLAPRLGAERVEVERGGGEGSGRLETGILRSRK